MDRGLLQRRIFSVLAIGELVPDVLGILHVALFIERHVTKNGLDRIAGAEPLGDLSLNAKGDVNDAKYVWYKFSKGKYTEDPSLQ